MTTAFKVPAPPETDVQFMIEQAADIAANTIHKSPNGASALECGWAVAIALNINGFLREPPVKNEN